jgi:hypothetical protein
VVFVVLGAVVLGLTGLGVAADAFSRRRRGRGAKGQWADDRAHAQFNADLAADHWQPPLPFNSPPS